MKDSLKQRTLRGIGWNFAAGFGQQAVQFAIGILIARTLGPTDFGLMGMIAIFVSLTRAMADAGLAAALIQKRESNDIDASSVFFVNLAVSIVLGGGLCWLARPIANFYSEPILEWLMYAMAMGPFFTAVGRVQSALLAKKMDFRTQFRITVIASFLSGLLGLGCALGGLGVWSLVIMALSLELIRSGLYWLLHEWRPRWVFSFSSIKEMSAFGFPLLGSTIVGTLSTNLYAVVIGKFYSAADVGFFNRARNIQRLPVANLSSAVGSVSFPAFAEVQDDLQRLRRGVRQALRLLAFCVFPIIAFLTGSAYSLITVVLTEKWTACVPYLQLLCFAEMFFPLAIINLNLIKARGRSTLYFWLTVGKQTFAMAALALTFQLGIRIIIVGQAVAAAVNFVINSYYSGKVLGYSSRDQILDVAPFGILAGGMGISVFALEFIPLDNHVWILVSQITAAFVVYLGSCWLFRVPELREAIHIVRRRFLASRRSKAF